MDFDLEKHLGSIVNLLGQIAGGMPNLVRNAPQLLTGLVPQPAQPFVAPLIQKGLTRGVDAITNTFEANLRASDLLWSTSNAAMRTAMDRATGKALSKLGLGDSLQDYGQSLSSRLAESIYGKNASSLTDTALYRLYGAGLQARTNSFLADTLIPAYSEGLRFGQTPLSANQYRQISADIIGNYYKHSFGSLGEGEIGSVVADRARYGGLNEKTIVDELQKIGKTLDNIKDIAGENVSLDQVRGLLINLTGSDLVRTSPALAKTMTEEMSYLNRRFGTSMEEFASSTQLMKRMMMPLGISEPAAAAYGITMAGLSSREKSRHFLVSDAQLQQQQAMEMTQMAADGTNQNLAIASLALESMGDESMGDETLTTERIQELLKKGVDFSDLTSIAKGLGYSGQRATEFIQRARMYIGSDLAAKRGMMYTEDMADISSYEKVQKRNRLRDEFLANAGIENAQDIFGTEDIGTMTTDEVEQRLHAAFRDKKLTKEQFNRAMAANKLWTRSVGGQRNRESMRSAVFVESGTRADYEQQLARVAPGNLLDTIAQAVNSDKDVLNELDRIRKITNPTERAKELEKFSKTGPAASKILSAVFAGKYKQGQDIGTSVKMLDALLSATKGDGTASGSKTIPVAANSQGDGVTPEKIAQGVSSLQRNIMKMLEVIAEAIPNVNKQKMHAILNPLNGGAADKA